MTWKWGNFPVPEQHLIGLFFGGGLHLLLDGPLLSNSWTGFLVGLALVMIGVGLAAWSVVAAGDIDIDAPHRLLVIGPYARSRNPMMVAWTSLYVGLGFAINSIWIMVLLLPVILWTHFHDILREEKYLAGEIGDQYLEYKRRVRRYI